MIKTIKELIIELEKYPDDYRIGIDNKMYGSNINFNCLQSIEEDEDYKMIWINIDKEE